MILSQYLKEAKPIGTELKARAGGDLTLVNGGGPEVCIVIHLASDHYRKLNIKSSIVHSYHIELGTVSQRNTKERQRCQAIVQQANQFVPTVMPSFTHE